MTARKPLGEMTEDELQAYMVESRAYAEDKARDDLKAEIERGTFPSVRTRNGVVSVKRLVPFDRTKANWRDQ